MRKFLSQKFWSHGTSLGSLGPLSQGDVYPGFSRPKFLVIWGPYNYSGMVACLEQAENPKLTYSLVWVHNSSIVMDAFRILRGPRKLSNRWRLFTEAEKEKRNVALYIYFATFIIRGVSQKHGRRGS